MNKIAYIFIVLAGLIIPNTMLAQHNGQVSGTVMDEYGPMPGATVFIEGTSFGTYSDLNGFFLLNRIPDGKYKLMISYVGISKFEKQIEINGGSAIDLGKIRIDMNVSISGVDIVATVRGSDTKAINMTKTSAGLVNILAAEGVGKMPDKNAAEAVQRLSGVNMEKDQGEGRYISFRGTPSDWSSALVNGSRMPVADEESKTRALNFDILPTSLIEYVIVSKTMTADIEGDAIGGSANFITRSAPSVRTLNASAGVGYNFQAHKPVYNLTLLWGDRSKNKKWGYLIGGSYYSRNWGTDNYQVYYGSNYNQSIYRLELRDYAGRRSTLGINIAMEYAPDSKNKIYLKGMGGNMRDNEYNFKTMYNYVAGFGNSIKLQNIHDIMNFSFYGGELGGMHNTKNSKTDIEWKLASYYSHFNYGPSPDLKGMQGNPGYYVNEWEKSVLFTDVLCLNAQGEVVSVFDPSAVVRAKFLDIDSPVEGYGDPYNRIIPTYIINPGDSSFKFSRAYTELLDNYDQDPVVAQIDINHQVSNTFKFKTGAKFRYKMGSRKAGLDYWERDPLVYNGAILYYLQDIHSLNLHGGFLNEIGAPYDSTFFPFLTNDALNSFIKDKGDTLRYNPYNENTPYYTNFVGSSYTYNEYAASLYFMSDIKLHALLFLNAGIRFEYTVPEVVADTVIEDFVNTTRYLSTVKAGKPYLVWLPSFNLKYSITESMNLRLSGSRSYRRPNFNEIKPGQPTIDFTNLELLSGNPDLKPTKSWNADLAWEHFWGNIGMASVSVFYKYVTNHIYTAFETDTLQNAFQVVGGVISKKYQNAPEAQVFGVEVVFNRKLTFLPGFLKNFGINANYTFTLSKMKIPSRNALQPLPRQSKNVANVSIFYESKRVSGKIGLNYKDPYLYELNLYAVTDYQTGEVIVVHQNNDYDLFVGRSISLDATVAVNINDHFAVFVEANNLTNYPFVIYRGTRERPVKTEYYSIRAMLGLKYNL